MNKIDLITALTNETDLTKSEAEAVVNLFFNEMANALAKGDRKNTKHMPGEIRKLGGRFVWNLRSYRFLSVARN